VISALWLLTTVTVVSLFLACMSAWLWLEPAEDRLSHAESRYQAAKQAKATLAKEHVLHASLQAAERQLERVFEALPAYDQFTSFSIAIAEMARDEHLLIPGMTYGVKKDSKDDIATEATISFTVSGPYASLYRFVHRLEEGSAYVVIDKMGARRTDKAAHEDWVSCDMVLTTYLRVTQPLMQKS
jgi:hypothetical protein